MFPRSLHYVICNSLFNRIFFLPYREIFHSSRLWEDSKTFHDVRNGLHDYPISFHPLFETHTRDLRRIPATNPSKRIASMETVVWCFDDIVVITIFKTLYIDMLILPHSWSLSQYINIYHKFAFYIKFASHQQVLIMYFINTTSNNANQIKLWNLWN